MRKLFMAALFVACATPFAFAQTDYNKYDVGVLYSHSRADVGAEDPNQNFLGGREGLHGLEAFVKGNVSRYVGLKGSYSFHHKTLELAVVGTPGFTFESDVDLHQFLGGAEFKDNAVETKVKPFAHVLAGVANSRGKAIGPAVSFSLNETGFAAAIGGGVDFKLNDRIDFRAVQFDYNPVGSGDGTSHNFRIGIGIIFR